MLCGLGLGIHLFWAQVLQHSINVLVKPLMRTPGSRTLWLCLVPLCCVTFGQSLFFSEHWLPQLKKRDADL
jgi:hypothetical protein